MGSRKARFQEWIRQHWPLHPHTVNIVDMALCLNTDTHVWEHTATRYRCFLCGMEFETSNQNAYRMLARGIRKEIVFVWQEADKDRFIQMLQDDEASRQEAK